MDAREFKDGIFGQFARIGSALGHAKRVEMVDVLYQGERTVESLAEQVDASVANTSPHLQILASAGLVTRRAEGNSRVYRLTDAAVGTAYRTLTQLAETHLSEVTALADSFFAEHDGARAVSIEELEELRRDGKVTLVDVRPASEFAAGHAEGAVNIPLAELESQLNALAELPENLCVVAYCRGPYCVMAARAVAQLRAHGIQATRLDGGYPDWNEADRAAERAA